MASQQAYSFARLPFARILSAIFLSIAFLLPVTAEATAQSVPRKYAGIVVDAKTGKVLYESASDSLRYPASVTKVMTLYVLFQELAAGNVTLNTKMRVSKHAAAAVPTKLGLKAGSTITVENAIKALVTLSANDIARVIAEHISGSESAFAERMTATARAMGMKRTTYRNASGLPDKGQTTTVRDQAILATAIYQHFPKSYAYFQTKSFTYGKRTYGNHNRLLGSNGVDGIKTGYINASGFNLMTAARKDGRHIVVIAFGFESGGARDSKVRDLVKQYLPKGRSGDYVASVPMPGRKGSTVQVASVQEPVFVVPAPFPTFRMAVAAPEAVAQVAAIAPVVPEPIPEFLAPDTVTTASIPMPVPAPPLARGEPVDIGAQGALQAANALGGQPEPAPIDVIGAWISETFSLGAEPAPLGQTRPSAPILPPIGIGEEGEPIDLMTSGSIGDAEPVLVAGVQISAPPPAGGWIVQVGAAPSEEAATGLLSQAASTVSALTGFRAFIVPFEKNGQTFYRARFAGFGGRDDANGMCNQIKKAKINCLAMQS